MPFAKRTIYRRIPLILGSLLLLFVGTAYFILPFFWNHFEHEPQLSSVSMRTLSAQNIPGDPLNVGFAGSEDDVSAAFARIGWARADPLDIKSDLEIAGSVLLDRAYATAPVSSLYYLNRIEDLAFEMPVGGSADKRHHIRLWKVLDSGVDGRAVWLGAVSFDKGVGLSHYTGQITHHIDGDLDKERDGLMTSMSAAGLVSMLYQVSGVGPTIAGRNADGDAYFTDGEVTIATLDMDQQSASTTPTMLDNPPLVKLKQSLWSAFAPQDRQ